VVQEKSKLFNEHKALQKKYDMLLPTLKQWQQKYELLMREKTLIGIERDRIQETLQNKKINFKKEIKDDKKKSIKDKLEKVLKEHTIDVALDDRPNHFATDKEKLPAIANRLASLKPSILIKAHSMAVGG
jgi:regulator of replication initiation timing